ncbi:MAG: hypothetical protein KF764_01040 [Labilithrix sp.]|nr:hypothetical protein [Labilithrix sp.]
MSARPVAGSARAAERSHAAHARRRSLVVALVASLVAAASASCSLRTESGEFGELPDKASFIDNKVSLFMEVRCGGLDCHGQVGRPLRIYGQTGLRLKAREDGLRDNSPTTDDERTENYRSVVGLEPEAMAECFESKGEKFATFQLLKKPLGVENDGIRHKGGPVLRPTQSDPGWQCLYGWVSDNVDAAECERASKITP